MILDRVERLSKDRRDRIYQGTDLLDSWIRQLLSQGTEVLRKDPHRIEDMATRAVDYGMPAVGRRLRLIPHRMSQDLHWSDFVMEEISYLLLVIRAVRSSASESLVHPEDLMTALGVSLRKQDVINHTEPVEDDWLYLGSRKETEENILVSRNWFFGLNHQRYALFLEFQVNRFVKLRQFNLGKMYYGYVHFYPSAIPLRVTGIPEADRPIPSTVSFKPHIVRDFQEIASKAFMANPFIRHMPACLARARVYSSAEGAFLADDSGAGLVLDAKPEILQRTRAYCMDRELILLGEYLDKHFTPISVFSQGFIEKI